MISATDFVWIFGGGWGLGALFGYFLALKIASFKKKVGE